MNTMSMNFQHNHLKLWTGVVACWLVCIGDLTVNFILGIHLPGYHMLMETESYLGRTGMPTAPYVAVWGIFFSILFLLFARSWYDFFPQKTKAVTISTALLILYGVGEGLGSGLVHFDQVNGHATVSGVIHQIFSMSTDTGLFVFPIFVLGIFPKKLFPRIHLSSWLAIGFGLSFNICFLLGKTLGITQGLLSLAGLWQRLFLLDYYLYLLFLTHQMLLIRSHPKP